MSLSHFVADEFPCWKFAARSICLTIGCKGESRWWGEQKNRRCRCGNAPMHCSSAAIKRDFPMPGSPVSKMTRPSPVLACSQRRNKNSSSSVRPTSEDWPRRNASYRLSIRLSLNTTQARSTPRRPFNLESVSSRYSKRFPTSSRVASEITTVPGSAAVWRRAARLGVSPTTAVSSDAPKPIRSPATTNPVSTPIRTLSVPGGPASVSREGTASTIVKPARIARSTSASCACG